MTERETIIRFKEEANTARIETVNAGLLRELDKAVKTNADIICEERTEESGVFVLPKRLLIYVHRWYISSASKVKRAMQAKEWREAAKHK